MSTIARAKEMFGEDNVMENVVKHFRALKGLDVDNDMHDRQAHQVFLDVIEELEAKLGKFEEADKQD